MDHSVYLVEHERLIVGIRLLIFVGGANVTDGDTRSAALGTAIQSSCGHFRYFHSDMMCARNYAL
jgi:hypothetical protein